MAYPSSSKKQDSEGGLSNWTAWLFLALVAIKVYPLVFMLLPLLRNRLLWVSAFCSGMTIVGVLLPWFWLGSDVMQYLYAVQRGQQVVSGWEVQQADNHSHLLCIVGLSQVSSSGFRQVVLIQRQQYFSMLHGLNLWPLWMGVVVFLFKTILSLRTKNDTATVFTLLILIHLLLQPGSGSLFLLVATCACFGVGMPEVQIKNIMGARFGNGLGETAVDIFGTIEYFTFSRAGWMTMVLLLTLMVLFYLSIAKTTLMKTYLSHSYRSVLNDREHILYGSRVWGIEYRILIVLTLISGLSSVCFRYLAYSGAVG